MLDHPDNVSAEYEKDPSLSFLCYPTVASKGKAGVALHLYNDFKSQKQNTVAYHVHDHSRANVVCSHPSLRAQFLSALV